ncbi:FxSxx-COOH system tetratricopeptide repeat protein [Saccharothrix luteola]|uniref:FxSxx-COOH system tetratricopeptide repeat protein n=1 Tax=Saccharothrix luteola TaxID=2893018 RepID=UPI001E2F1269|nr:FxSxx-COOH system tetratricopeptide repeat protein [Saccharothrix luteola]MCC8248546.1 FxSxx-COOH system tetratricopeptide repeat protein [Saccharothrix luteola]
MTEGQRAEASDGSRVYQAGRDVIVNQPAPAPPAPPVWNLPPRNPNFTGREDVLARIHEGLSTSVVSVHSLHGLGGVGKSQTAIEYAYRHRAEYQWAYWIPAEQPELIPDHFERLKAALGLPATADLRSVLSAEPGWLLIFDNAERPGDVHEHLPVGGHVLVTTRNTGFGGLGRTVELDALSRPESVDFLRGRVPATTAEQADRLADVLGDLPLGLAQAAAYLEETALPVEEYLTLLDTHESALLAEGDVPGYPHTVATVWGLSLQRVARQEPVAVAGALISAYLAPDDIPLEPLRQAIRQDDPRFADATADPVRWMRAIGLLVKYGLVRRTGDTISMHRLLQAALRSLPERMGRDRHAFAKSALLVSFYNLTDTTLPPMSHLLAALSYTRFAGGQAVEVYRKSAEHAAKLYGPDHALTRRLRRLTE